MVEQAGRIRRAQSDEAITDTLPNEELRVGETPVLNLDTMIAAQDSRAGLWWNPKVWSDLAEVSSSVHHARRTSRHYDFLQSLDWDSAEFDVWRARATQNEERAQNIQLSDESMKMFMDIEDTRQKAMRDGSSVFVAMNNLRNNYLKHADTLDKKSAYMGEQFRKSLNSAFNTALPSAIVKDAEINELRAEANSRANTNMMGTWLLTSRDGDFETAIQTLADINFKKRYLISDNQDDVQTNNDYNTLFVLSLQKYQDLYKSGELSLEEVKSGVMTQLAKYSKWDVQAPNDRGEIETVRCTLTPETVSATKEFLYKLQKDKNKAEAVYASQSYNDLTEKRLTDKDDSDAWVSSLYYRSTSLAKGQQDWIQYRNALMGAASDGDQQALNDLKALDVRWYTVVRPRLMLMNVANSSLADTGDYKRAYNDIASRAAALGKWIEEANATGVISDDVPSLMFTSTDNTIIANFGYPSGDLNYGASILSNGEPLFGNKINYYSKTYEQMNKFLEALARDPDLFAGLNPEYTRGQDEAIRRSAFMNMTVTSPKDGMVLPNIQGQDDFAQGLRNMNSLAQAYGGKRLLNADSAKMLSSFADTAKNLNGDEYAAYARSIAQGYIKAGVVTPFASYRNRAASREEQQFAADVAMWGYLESNPSLKKYSDWVYRNKIGGVDPDPTLGNSDRFITERSRFRKKGDSLEQEMQLWFNEYNIPEDFRPSLRHTIVNLAVGILNHDEKAQFDSNLIGDLLSANFSSKGTFKYSNALGELDINALDNEVERARNMINKGIKNLGIPGTTTTQVDYKTGSVKLYTDGAQFMGYGVYDPLRGSGVVPFQIWVNNRPADMDEGKYNQSIAIMTAGATLLGAMAGIDTNGVLQRYADRVAPNVKASDIKALGIQYMNALGQEEVQREFIQYRNSNYRNIKVQSAPQEVRALMVESLNTFFHRSQTRVTKDEMNHLIDFLYTRSQNNRRMRVDVPVSTYYESKGYPFTNITARVNSAGWIITSAAEGYEGDRVHYPNSKHYKGLAIDIGGPGSFDAVFNYKTGRFYESKINALYNNFLKPEVGEGNIQYIRTDSRLINALPSHVRNLKNKQGQNIWVSQDTGDHYNHFHVEFYEKSFKPGTKDEINSAQVFTGPKNVSAMYTNLNSLGTAYRVTRAECKAALTLLWNYKVTSYDAQSTGHTVEELMSSPFLQAQTALRQVAKATQRLGDRDAALMGLAGAKYKLRYKGPSTKGIKRSQTSSKEYTFQEFLQRSDEVGTSRGGLYEWELVLPSSQAEFKRLKDFVDKFNRAGY